MNKERTIRKLKEKGITLVALVVTIIILLILAGVTLNLALGEGGIFARARNTVDRYQSAQENELGQLSSLEKDLDKYGQGGTPTTPDTPPIGSNELAGKLKEYQGKYVDIGLNTNDTSETTDDWELFYAADDRIYLIAADYVPVATLTEWGVIGSGKLATNGFVGSSSNKYGVYWSSPKFLSVDSSLLSTLMFTGYDLNAHQSNTNSIATSHLLNKEAWSVIKEKVSTDKQQYIDYVIGGPTIQMWCAAWNKAVEGDPDFKQINVGNTNSYGFYVSSDTIQDQYNLYMDGTSNELGAKLMTLGANYKIFFPHTEAVNDCYRVLVGFAFRTL